MLDHGEMLHFYEAAPKVERCEEGWLGGII
jgi:hypothetical protein